MDRLKKTGLKITDSRVDILSVIDTAKTPISAADIHTKKGIDITTVYRTLETFEKAGLIRRVDLRTDTVLYESVKNHHHHIVCTSCGVIEDFENCTVSDLSKNILKKAKRFSSIDDHSFELFGVCDTCK